MVKDSKISIKASKESISESDDVKEECKKDKKDLAEDSSKIKDDKEAKDNAKDDTKIRSPATKIGESKSESNSNKNRKDIGWHSEATQKFIYSDKFIQELILQEKNEIFRPPKLKARMKFVIPDDVKDKAVKRDQERQALRKKVVQVKKN